MPAPVDPGLIATAFGYRGDARVRLDPLGAIVALTVFAEGCQQPWRHHRASAGQWLEQQLVIGELGGRGGNLLGKAIDGLKCHPQLIDQNLSQQPMRRDDGRVVR